MQSLETSRNVLILKEVLRYLKNKKTKLVLYTYDALLFDFNKEDGKETLEELKEILESGGKYPIKFKYSNDLCL
jgi:phage-related protein